MDESTTTQSVDATAQNATEPQEDVSVQTETQAVASPDAAVSTEQKTDGQQAETPKADSKEIGRLVNVIKNLQAENAKLKEPKQDTGKEIDVRSKIGKSSIPDGLPKEVAEHPALQGLAVDTDEAGEFFAKVGGRWVHVEDVIERYEDRQQLAELREMVHGDRTAREEAEYRAQVEKAQADLYTAVETAVKSARAESLPGLSAEHADLADEYILGQAEASLGREIGKGTELSAELIESSTAEAIAKAKQLFGVFGQKQVEDNLATKQKERVKPDATTAVPAEVPYDKLPERDQRSYIEKLAANVTAKLRSG